jgi:hypothetical protein
MVMREFSIDWKLNFCIRARSTDQKREYSGKQQYLGPSMISVGKWKCVGLSIYMLDKRLCIGQRDLPLGRDDPGCMVLAPRQRWPERTCRYL